MSMELEEQYDRIYRYCYYKLRHVQMAEDITQEVFLRYFEHEYAENARRPLAYLYTIARNLCIDQYRRKKIEMLPENLSENNQGLGMEDYVMLRQALAELTVQEREMVLLRYVNDVPIADMAQFYQISRFALYRKLKNVLKKLERRISDES